MVSIFSVELTLVGYPGVSTRNRLPCGSCQTIVRKCKQIYYNSWCDCYSFL